jgi:hypothetical protein
MKIRCVSACSFGFDLMRFEILVVVLLRGSSYLYHDIPSLIDRHNQNPESFEMDQINRRNLGAKTQQTLCGEL